MGVLAHARCPAARGEAFAIDGDRTTRGAQGGPVVAHDLLYPAEGAKRIRFPQPLPTKHLRTPVVGGLKTRDPLSGGAGAKVVGEEAFDLVTTGKPSPRGCERGKRGEFE